jgi:NitT/TauT family transport system ATP-binding protein
MSLFDIRNLSKVYEGEQPVQALDNVSLSIEASEFVVLLGPSGCGKSTFLEILAGLQSPSRGGVLFGGNPIGGPNNDLGLVFQDPSLMPWRTIYRNVQLGPEIRGVEKRESRAIADKYLSLVGLDGFGDKYPHQLSGGMRQRAGLARALANDPDVLLMDEPFGAVDYITRIKLQEDLVAIWQRNKKTVIFVTHDVGEAVFLADRIILLSPRPGRIFEIFNVRNPRPRERGALDLLQQEAEVYRALHAVEAGDPRNKLDRAA